MIFDYQKELDKLKAMSKDEFMELIGEVQHIKGFSSYYIPKWEVLDTYFTTEEREVVLDGNIAAEKKHEPLFTRLIDIQDCYSEAGNFLFS